MKISKQILNAINSLAKKYNFNVDEAVAYLTDAKTDPGSDSSVKTENDKVETCRKNIALWQKKLDEGKIKDELREKHVEKIDKEQKKLDKLLSSDSKDDKSTKSASSEKKEQRIKKVTPATASQLKTALEKEGIEVNDENKKKFVEEYKQYVNDMPEDDYMRSGSGDVMKAFAKLKLPPAVAPVVPVEAPAEVPVVADKKKSRIDRLDGKKLKASFERESVEFKEDFKKEFKKYVDEMTDEQYKKCVLTDHMDAFAKSKKTPAKEPEDVSENNDKVFELSLKELQSISMLTHMGESVRLYWDGDNGRVVQGPDRDDDEDFEEIKFDGRDYVIGQKTGRVYEALDQGDVFAGYVGVLKFKMLTI
jgi:hypothetical protein